MARLQNRFTWSFSAAADFEECRRKRFWNKYAKWGGWERNATELQRTAYHLDKMDNRFTLQGDAVERTILWVLRQSQQGNAVTAEQAYEEVARPHLNNAWRESKAGLWRRDAKKHCCLHEHYYPDLHPGDDTSWTEGVIATIKQCTANFIEHTLPRLAGVTPAMEIPIANSETGGDPESFELEGIKIYAIPDYAYRRDGRLVIHDWKSGKPRPTHQGQMALYGLWAQVKHGASPDDIDVTLEYLADGSHHTETLNTERLEEVMMAIGESVADMTMYLIGEDREQNRPVPQEEWDLAPDRSPCRHCNFHQLCAPEFGQDPL